MAKVFTLLGFGVVIVLMFVAGAYNGYLNGFTAGEAAWWALSSLAGMIGIGLFGFAFSRMIGWMRSRHAR